MTARKPKQPAGVPELGPGGQALWAATWREGLPETLVTLLTEACRARDRLDKLDRLLRGDIETWASIDVDHDGTPISLRIDAALGNANSTASNLRMLLEQIAKATTTAPAKPAEAVRNPLDELRARRSGKAPAAKADSKAAK